MADNAFDNNDQPGGQARVNAMLRAGAPQDQVLQWKSQRMQQMIQAGAPADQVDAYWNGHAPDTGKLDRTASATTQLAAEDTPAAPGAHVASGIWENFQAGLQASSGGLWARGKLPDVVPDGQAGFWGKVANSVGGTAGDLPAMVLGSIPGAAAGAAVPGGGETGITELAGAGAGGYAAPTAMREALVDYYQHGGNYWQDFWSRYVKITKDTAKSAVEGAISFPLGGAVGGKLVEAGAKPLVAEGANLLTQSVAATSAGVQMGDKMPNKDDFMAAAVTVLGMSAAGHVAGTGGNAKLQPNATAQELATNIMTTYARTGLTPKQIIDKARTDPVFKSELLGPSHADGTNAQQGYFGQKMPEQPQFKTNPMKIQQEHDDEMMRLHTDAVVQFDKATQPFPRETLSVVRQLESSGDTAVSPAGAIGRYQIMPETAKQYGFDPARLKDPAYNERVATTVLADLQKQFKGNLADMLVAYNAGPGRARMWIRMGRNLKDLPLETQRYLEHAERLGAIDGGFNGMVSDNLLSSQGDSGNYLPAASANDAEPWTTTVRDDLTMKDIWSAFRGAPQRVMQNGDRIPAPEAIASYLQKFGKAAGFHFAVGPGLKTEREFQGYSNPNRPGPMYFEASKGEEQRRGVYIPENTDAETRRWYGLGASEVLYHEVGHALDHNVIKPGGGTKYLDTSSKMYDEMLKASKAFRPKLWRENPHYNMRPSEIMADAIAQWFSNPSMRKQMPEFTKAYGKKLSKYAEFVARNMPIRRGDNPDTGEGEWGPPGGENFDFGGMDEEWDNAAAGGAGGKGGPPGPPHPPGFEPREPEPSEPIESNVPNANLDTLRGKFRDLIAPEAKQGIIPDWMNPRKLLTYFQAALTPANTMDEKLGLSGKELGIADMLRQTYASKERASYFIRTGTLDPTAKSNEIIQTSDDNMLKSYAMVKEAGGNVEDFTYYRMALRTVEKAGDAYMKARTQIGALKYRRADTTDPKMIAQITKEIQRLGKLKPEINTGIDPHVAEAFLDKLKEAHNGRDIYEDAHKVMQNVKDASVDYATNSGLFSPEQAQAMKDLNRAHIVFKRALDPTYNPNYGKGFNVRMPVRKMKGSDKQIVDPVTADVDNLHTIIAMADRNRAIGNIIGLIESKNKIAEIKGLPAVVDMEKVGESEGPSMKGELFDENGNAIPPEQAKGAEPFLATRRMQGRLGPDDFIYYRNGVPEIWRVKDPNLAEIIRSEPPSRKTNLVVQLFTKFAGLARAGITADLGYPFRAVTHGQLASAVAAQHGALPFRDAMSGFWDVVNKSDAYREWQRNGGAATALSDLDRNYIQKDIDKIFDKTDTTFSVYNSFRHPIEMMREIQHNVDAMSRVGYYKRITGAHEYSPMKAAMLARTAYLDNMEGFSGQWVNTWSHMVPFMPIGFKDIEQVGAAIKRNPVSFMVKAGVIITLPTVLNYLLNYEADQKLPPGQRYSDLPRWQRDMYWVTPPINGVRYNIKRPYTMGFLAGTIPERFMDYMVEQDPRAFKEWKDSMIAQYMPPFTPAFIQPIAEQYTNKNFYTGRPLVKDSLARLSGYMQYKPDTTETAKNISKLLGPPGLAIADTSPIVVQNYAREWLGTLPMEVLKALEMPFKPPGKPGELSDLPFVGSFITRHPDMGAQPIMDFYDEMDKLETAHADFRMALARQDMSEVKDTTKLQAFVNISDLKTAMRNQEAVIDAINENNTMTPDEKRQRTDALYSALVVEAQAGLKAIDKINEQ